MPSMQMKEDKRFAARVWLTRPPGAVRRPAAHRRVGQPRGRTTPAPLPHRTTALGRCGCCGVRRPGANGDAKVCRGGNPEALLFFPPFNVTRLKTKRREKGKAMCRTSGVDREGAPFSGCFNSAFFHQHQALPRFAMPSQKIWPHPYHASSTWNAFDSRNFGTEPF